MKVAIPIWDGRVSPVMDTARQLLLVDIENGETASRKVVNVPPLQVSNLARFISGLGAEVIICGAICRQLETMLAAMGIQTIPWITGEVEDVISVFARREMPEKRFLMPGCGRGRRRGWRRGRGGRLGGEQFFEEDI